ncbi:hypothetical protein I547_3092 [Mycobacterium kansasii 824]|nr:hypothetical protein I547_3092 [Mycobacterium kansasii 824]
MVGWWGGAGVAVALAFVGDALSTFLGAGAASFGHHGGPLTAVIGR